MTHLFKILQKNVFNVNDAFFLNVEIYSNLEILKIKLKAM